jgi:soluble lytic murein transglycosylase-like protein
LKAVHSSVTTRRARAGLLLGALLVLLAVAGTALRGDGPAPGVPLVPAPPGAEDGERFADPFAYHPDREAEFMRRAAAGTSHVLYARSPGGATATARRVARWRPQVETAAQAADMPADLLEGLVLLESAGREDAMAGDTEGAVGLTQILAETAQNLLGMRVNVARSARLTRRIARQEARGRGDVVARLVAERREVDERYDGVKALAGTARYLTFARGRLGRRDLALAAYHMGVGNLQEVIRLSGEESPSYAQLYFEATPHRNAAVQRRLAAFGDDSSTYLFKVHAAAEIMRLYREDPSALARLEGLHASKNSAEEVLHPPGPTPSFATPESLARAWDEGEVRLFPRRAAVTGLARDPAMGALADRLRVPRGLYRGLRPEALAMALYIGAQVRAYAGGDSPLLVTSTVRDETYQRLLVDSNFEASRRYSLHTTGWAFDVARSYRSGRQALAFQFVLDRLQVLNAIAWVREPDAIHITVGRDAAALEPLLERLEP